MPKPPRSVVIDCDPGQDDAVAILLAARHLDVTAVTTVHGNQSVGKVTGNALRVLTLAGLEHIPVHAGTAGPLVGRPHHAPEVHGESGLDGAELPDPAAAPAPAHAVDVLREAARGDEELTIVATGPLTNLAAALRLDPSLADRVREISLMGGAVAGGNVTPAAEFNVWADPEAARLVFRSGIPIRMSGLDLTHQALVGADEIGALRAAGTRVASTCADLLAFYVERAAARTGVAAAPLHDPCAVAWLIDPSLVEAQPLHVDVELRGELTRGMTVCDTRPRRGGQDGGGQPPGEGETGPQGVAPPNAQVGLRLDTHRFLALLVDTLSSYG